MRMQAAAVLLFLAGTSCVMAHDTLLTQALSRAALPASDLQGSIRTTSIVLGGKQPEIKTETVDLKKSPDHALASYAELKDVIGPDAHVIGQTAGRTIYAFTTSHLPHGTSKAGNIRIDDDTDQVFAGKAEVSVDANGKPFVSHVDLHLPKAEGSFLARVRRIDVSYAFSPVAAKDTMVATALSVDVDIRALFFVHRNAHAEAMLVMETPNQ